MKTESRTIDTPSWANFKAQDDDGQWWWYADEPVICTDTYTWVSDGKIEVAGPIDFCNELWTHTLTKV